MMDLLSDTCYQCDGDKLVMIYNQFGLVRYESPYQIHFLHPDETWEIACAKCGLMYSRNSLTTPQQFEVRNG